MAVPIGVPGRGVWGRVEGGGEGGFSLENKGKRGGEGGEGGGWDRDQQVNAQALSKLPFSELPFSFSPNHVAMVCSSIAFHTHLCGEMMAKYVPWASWN